MSPSPVQRFLLRWGGPIAAIAAVSAAESWLYADAVLRGAASPPPRTLSILFGAAGGPAVLFDMFVPAVAVNLLVFAWCRRRVEAQRAKVAEAPRGDRETGRSPFRQAAIGDDKPSILRNSLASAGADMLEWAPFAAHGAAGAAAPIPRAASRPA